MAAKSCDDPVDLGPFLQNYVMKNPFSESSLLVTSSSSLPSSVPVVSSPSETSSSGTQSMYGVQDAITIDKRPRTVAEMLRKARGSETISGDKSKRVGNVRPSVTSSNSATTTTLRPIRPRIVVENKEPASVAVTTPIVVQAVGMAPVGMTPVTVQAAPVVMHQTIAAAAAKHAAKISRPKPAKSTASIVIPSSVGIANAKKSVVMLANPDEMMGKYGNSADCDRTQIESWMRDNYRYLHGNRRLAVSSQHLLLRAQQYFPSVTGDLLDDIVRCLYPKCEKFPKRHGPVYVGLVARPEPDILDNPVFMAALESVITGVLPVRCAAEKFGIRETSLIAAVMWTSVESNSAEPNTGEGNSQSELDRLASRSDASDGGCRRKRRASKDPSVGDDVSGSQSPEPRRIKSENDDNFDLEMIMLQDAHSTSSLTESLSRECTPSRQASSATAATAGETRSTSPLMSSSFERVEIKSEPIDVEDPIEVRLPDDDDDDDGGRCNGSPFNGVGGGSSNRSPSYHSFDVANELADGAAGCRLDGSGSSSSNGGIAPTSPENEESEVWLQAELAKSRKANLALQEELSTRDFQLAQLAEDFFRLHDQFKQLARQFQVALGEVQPVRSNVNGFVGGARRR